jgi:hypothetical protein
MTQDDPRITWDDPKITWDKPAQNQTPGDLKSKTAQYGKKALGWIAEEGPTVIGAAGGGILGSVAGPVGTVGGAALGAATARTIQNFLKQLGGDKSAPHGFKESAIDVGKAAVSGGLQEIGEAVPLSKTGIAPALKGSAEKKVAQVLGATKETAKDITEKKLVPGILERGTVAMSRKGLKSKIETALGNATALLDKVWSAIPDTDRLDTAPIIKALEDAKQHFIVDGVTIEPGAVSQLTGIQKTIGKFGNRVSPQSLRKVRGVWDEIVARSGGYAGKDLSEASKVYARREAASAIRKELASKYPDVAKVNAEYSFWKNMDDVLGSTLKRTQSQSKPLGEQLVRASAAAGGLTGYYLGAPAAEAGIGTALVIGLNKLVRSTGWKMVSAQTKSRLSDLIASGSVDEAAAMVNRLVVKGPSMVSQPVKNRQEALDALKKNQ